MQTPCGGSHTHSPVSRLAYMRSRVRGSMISTHSNLQGDRPRTKQLTHRRQSATAAGQPNTHDAPHHRGPSLLPKPR
ncbi:hypothetical protein EYF80_012316 [Liparis tanakae]|uniref:Uncharacterized protein n=1 Tax=Liparis tanakae TaxID=230148 RepID=A0A4Z2IJQ9_9TELE|nr:hypothetical protein EYF80_012316 [Liparis tanakae]